MNQSTSPAAAIAQKPGFIVLKIENMDHPLVRGLDKSVLGFVTALGLKAEVRTPKTEPVTLQVGAMLDNAMAAMLKTTGGMARELRDIVERIVLADVVLTVEELADKYDSDVEGANQHPLITREDWIATAAAKETELGYWQWVESQLEQLAMNTQCGCADCAGKKEAQAAEEPTVGAA